MDRRTIAIILGIFGGAAFLGLVAFIVIREVARNNVTPISGYEVTAKMYPELAVPEDRVFTSSGAKARPTDRTIPISEASFGAAAVFWATQSHLIPTVMSFPLAADGEHGDAGYATVIPEPLTIQTFLPGHETDPALYGCLEALNGLQSKAAVRTACGFLGPVDFQPVFNTSHQTP